MAVAIKMPDLGTTEDTVVLLKWLKQVGDEVKRGEPLCEIQTDKAVTELESVAKGVLLKQVVEEGSEVSTGTVIAYIGQAGEQV
jgi:pyruvate dehydrogenase E2 component (dihydrolipoamide acetyltransferase)